MVPSRGCRLPQLPTRNADWPEKQKAPPERGFLEERLMGFEPTTFCMASRRSSQLSYSRANGEYSPGPAAPDALCRAAGTMRRSR